MRPTPRIDVVGPIDLSDQARLEHPLEVAVEWAGLEINVPRRSLTNPLHHSVPVQVALCQRKEYVENRRLQREQRSGILFSHFILAYQMDMYELDI